MNDRNSPTHVCGDPPDAMSLQDAIYGWTTRIVSSIAYRPESTCRVNRGRLPQQIYSRIPFPRGVFDNICLALLMKWFG